MFELYVGPVPGVNRVAVGDTLGFIQRSGVKALCGHCRKIFWSVAAGLEEGLKKLFPFSYLKMFDTYSTMLPVHLVMTHCAKCLEILLDILAAFGVVLDVMKFQMPRVRRVPFIMRPIALTAHIPVASHYFTAHIIRDLPVMFRALSICL